MKTLHLKHALTPLLLSLAVSQACAVEIVRTGVAGIPGAPGATYLDPGETGGEGGAVWQDTATSDARSRLTLTGGQGGEGGAAGTNPPWIPPEYGSGGGEGGQGGLVNANLDARRTTGPVAAELIMVGGVGGDGGMDNFGGTTVRPGGVGGVVAGNASAVTGAGNAHVRVRATGGAGGAGTGGGAASASGTASAANGVATGDVLVEGGAGGRSIGYGGIANSTGDATAALALAGGGAVGTSHAIGGASAISMARATTSGRSIVDLTSLAQITQGGDARAELFVDSGYGGRAAGGAAVSGKALATAADGVTGTNTARVTLQGSGAITGAAEARGSNAYDNDNCPLYYCRLTGSADSFASGVTRGSGNVTITALALGGKPRQSEDPDNWQTEGGWATASASGQSGSGAVNVSARARSYSSSSGTGWDEPFANPVVRASAVTTAAGGSTHAEAVHESLGPRSEYKALAEASSVGSGGARAVAIGIGGANRYGGMLESRASASGAGMTVSTRNQLWAVVGDASATSDASVGGALHGLPATDGKTALVSYATGLPAADTVATLLGDSPTLASTGANWLGAGVSAYSATSYVLSAATETQYTFATGDGQHLLLGLFGAQNPSGAEFGVNFSVSNNGTLLFTRSMPSEEFTLFFTDRLLDLGLLGSGMQNLTIATNWYSAPGSDSSIYGFRYVMGVTPVPEPATWLAMLLGLGTLVMVARRRQRRM